MNSDIIDLIILLIECISIGALIGILVGLRLGLPLKQILYSLLFIPLKEKHK